MFSSVLDVRLALTPGALATDKETAAHFSDVQLADAINEADGIIKSYLGSLYKIEPFAQEQASLTDPNAIVEVEAAAYPVRGWSRDIAAFLATLTYMKHKDVGEDDPARLRFAMAMAHLDLARKGQFYLDPDDFPVNTEADAQTGASVYNLYEGTLFAPSDFRLAPEGVASPQILWPVYWGS